MKQLKDFADDKTLKRYLSLKKRLKPLQKALDELADYLKERGTFSTEHFVCSVEDRKRTGIISLSEAIDMLGKTAVEDAGLIKVSHFKIISVTEKNPKLFVEDAVK